MKEQEPLSSDLFFECTDFGSSEDRRKAVSTFQAEKGDLVSINLKPGYKLGKDSTGKKLMFVEDSDITQPRRLAGIVTGRSNHYAFIGLISGVDGDSVDLEIDVPLKAIDGYRTLTSDMTKRYMI